MKAIVIDAASENYSLNWEEVPDPAYGADEVLVDIHATAVNRADLLQRTGNYPPPPGAPPYMGLEMAGTIAAVGALLACGAPVACPWPLGTSSAGPAPTRREG